MDISERRILALDNLLILLVVSGLFLTSCSIFRGSSSTSLPLPVLETQSSLSFERITQNSNLYQLLDDQRPIGIFLTSIQDCSFEKPTPSAVTTRQLLVGLTEIKLEKQEKIHFGDMAALRSIITAKLDTNLLRIVCFTVQKESCITDLVLWSTLDGEQRHAAPFEAKLNQFSVLAEEILPAVVR